jgi:hypothetical protein
MVGRNVEPMRADGDLLRQRLAGARAAQLNQVQHVIAALLQKADDRFVEGVDPVVWRPAAQLLRQALGLGEQGGADAVPANLRGDVERFGPNHFPVHAADQVPGQTA